MKNLLYLALVAIAFTSCQQQKIGYIDNGIVINDFQEKRDLEADFLIVDEAFKQRADSIGQAFQMEVKLAQDIARKSTQAEAQQIMSGLQQKQQMLQQQMQIEQQELTLVFQSSIDTLIVKVQDFVEDYGEKNGYTYILGTSDASSSVLYGTDENNLTQTVLDALNAEYEK